VENKRAGQKIEDHLLMEGKKLQEKQVRRLQEEKNQKQQKVTNNQSEKYITAKFNREFEALVQEMFTHDSSLHGNSVAKQLNDEGEHEGGDIAQRTINYLRLKELLILLGMIDEKAANSDSNERVLLYELWKLLRGEERQEIALNDVKMVIMVVLRMHQEHKRVGGAEENRYGQVQSPQEQEDPNNIGFYNDQDKFCLRANDVSKVHKKFNIFYLNRLQHLGRMLEFQKQQKANVEEFKYKPQLNENST
jgi:hypothetical protein